MDEAAPPCAGGRGAQTGSSIRPRLMTVRHAQFDRQRCCCCLCSAHQYAFGTAGSALVLGIWSAANVPMHLFGVISSTIVLLCVGIVFRDQLDARICTKFGILPSRQDGRAAKVVAVATANDDSSSDSKAIEPATDASVMVADAQHAPYPAQRSSSTRYRLAAESCRKLRVVTCERIRASWCRGLAIGWVVLLRLC